MVRTADPSERAGVRSNLARGRKTLQMSDAFQAMLDSGLLYFVFGAVICVILGIGAAKRLFAGAKKAEPPDPQDRPRHKH
jgi:hypothetical protein